MGGRMGSSWPLKNLYSEIVSDFSIFLYCHSLNGDR